MKTIRLDRDGSAPVLDGYTLVSTEVEFLRLATEGRPLHIRGDRLCSWAEAFYTARDIAFQETPSYMRELRSLLPALSATQISGLISLLGSRLESLERPLEVGSLLNAAAPHTLWHQPPSLQHLAEWLLWLEETEILDCVEPLLEPHIVRWQMEELPFETELYGIRTKEAAKQALDAWLGFTDRDSIPIRQEFPVEVPKRYQEKARNVWREEIIQSKGAKFEQLSHLKIPFSLKRIAAEEAYGYYLRNQNDLNVQRLEQLVPYLKGKQIASLRSILPPAQPSALPSDPNGIVSWYIREYLPYREWQRSSGSAEGQEVAFRAALEFEKWYLENYPKGLNLGALHRWISFNKVNQVECIDNSITLLIILDGMHVPDSRLLLQNILTETQRLTIASHEYVFAPIPTVTRFAKEALLKGVPPSLTENLEPIGRILPEKHSPALRLRDAERGKIYFWRVLEPDDTYHHKNTSENLLHDVEGRLAAEASKIKEIVESIPDGVILQIIITTDHGRLLSETHKTIPVPMGMESHGRAAWGQSPYSFETTPYRIEGDVAYLMADNYGLSVDVAIPLDEGAFKDNNNRSGSELFPHGGIFPEEVILPWIVLARDQVQPEATITISGNGRARRDGNFVVTVLNKSDIDLFLETVTLTLRTGTTINISADQKIPARTQTPAEIPYNPWPSAGELETVHATVRLRLPNKMVYEYSAETSIQSEDIYTRPRENILEDLD